MPTPREVYELTWPGKKAAIEQADVPVQHQLCLKSEISQYPLSTQNRLIIGDNLPALKILFKEEAEPGFDLCYIDPPYNTGNDFVYADNFRASEAHYRRRHQLNADENADGRRHADWLSMIYPRLKLTRQLLKTDGVIFISIDDHEVHHLRIICDEIFGPEQMVAHICHKSRASISNDKIISPSHHHILMYTRDIEALTQRKHLIGLPPDTSGFQNPDKDPKGPWKPVPVDGPGGARKGNPHYTFLGVTGYFRFAKSTMEKMHAEGRIIQNAKGLQQKRYLADAIQKRKTITTWWDDAGLTANATRQLNNMMGTHTFDSPKPVTLIERMLDLVTHDRPDANILDFFGGSGTTGHAVMKYNAENGGKRRFTLIQIPAACPKHTDAYKAGYQTIPQICIERLQRAGRAITKAHPEQTHLDTGFNVYELAPL